MKQSRSRAPLLLFLGAECAVYGSFLYCDLVSRGAAGTALKYAALLLCLLFSLARARTADGKLVALCLALTALADLFLLVLDRDYAAGIALFCAVQLLYALRIRRARRRPPSLLPRLLLSGGAALALLLAGRLTPVLLLVCLYFPQLLLNALESRALPPTPQNRLFCAGLFLFLACDVCVGFHNSPDYLPFVPPWVTAFSQIAMWGFYLPSQVLIVFSVRRRSPL